MVYTTSTRAPSETGRRVILATHTIDLTYVGRGIHEELIAYVADQEGYFEDEGVSTSPSATEPGGRLHACAPAQPSVCAGPCCRG
jgi:hypothetical protein